MLTGLRIAQALGAKNALLGSDLHLIIGQVKGDFEANETRMQRYLKLMNQLVSKFDQVEFAQVPRDQNVEVDEVVRSASTDNQAKVNGWKLEKQNYPNINEFQTFPVHTHARWTSPILSYLKDGRLPPNSDKAKKIKK